MARKTWAVGDVLTATDMNQYVTNAHQALTASEVPLIVQGAASQTADLAEFQDSTGAVKASVGANGRFFAQTIDASGEVSGSDIVVNSGALYSTSGSGNTVNFFGAALNVTPRDSGSKGAVIRALASQTDDLQQWQDSAGAVLAKVDSIGGFWAGGIHAGDQAVSTNTYLSAVSNSATTVVVAIQGAASQSGNLTEWRNSAGTMLARIAADGSYQGDGIQLTNLGIDAGTNPSFGTLYQFNGVLKYRGPSGTLTTIAPA